MRILTLDNTTKGLTFPRIRLYSVITTFYQFIRPLHNGATKAHDGAMVSGDLTKDD